MAKGVSSSSVPHTSTTPAIIIVKLGPGQVANIIGTMANYGKWRTPLTPSTQSANTFIIDIPFHTNDNGPKGAGQRNLGNPAILRNLA